MNTNGTPPPQYTGEFGEPERGYIGTLDVYTIENPVGFYQGYMAKKDSEEQWTEIAECDIFILPKRRRRSIMITEGSDNAKDKESIERADWALTPPEQANKQVAQGTLNTLLRETNFLTVSAKALQFGKCGSEKKLLRAKFDY